MSLNRQWFVPGDDIAREVITADIQRYLGPDATVRPGTGTGEYEGMDGFWITAYRTLTSNMIKDLKQDSQRWRAEMAHGRVAYQDSTTHQARQHYGPTPGPSRHDPAAAYQQTAPSYATGYGNYTHQQPSRGGYAQQPQQPQYATPGYQEPVRTTAPSYSYGNQDTQAAYGAYQQPQQDPRYPYAQTTAAPRQDIYSPQQQQPRYFGYYHRKYLVLR
ncbi:hypothetical protein EJ05DRAFT_331458 [Pseudovirgaria hyperparasitica]|uniref:Transcription factor RfeG n=1 Tax=Pseudovirgaria hyperparasitica TaxID=470096 RepID=A0A6A6WAS8_9PEZI|nr:uncharacterized protein EJ05DRAFT_331458 [Pseudovirgaria hyperparasitica]KAF2759060.1 hypothetical protein EJ05DRAFT_331458 [Pseudovirgaria hyperparasitica]